MEIDVVEQMISELSELDKKGDAFRYPTSYSLEYKINEIQFDIKQVFEFMKRIIDFLDTCDTVLEEIAELQRDARSYYGEW